MPVDVNQIDDFNRFGVAMLIGLLVGLQREYAKFQETQEEKTFGGARTFALLGLLGCTAAFLAERSQSVLAFVVIIAIGGGLIRSSPLLAMINNKITIRFISSFDCCF